MSLRLRRRMRLVPWLGLLVALLAFGGSPAVAELESQAFTEERFRDLQEQDALILVDVAADWCPTCALQHEILRSYREKRPDVRLHVLRVDFDEQKQWVKHFGAPRQSTLVLYRGEERLWFSVAETDASVIFAAIDEAASAG